MTTVSFEFDRAADAQLTLRALVVMILEHLEMRVVQYWSVPPEYCL